MGFVLNLRVYQNNFKTMYSTTNVATHLTQWYSDIGTGLTTGVTAILVGMGALLVLGFVTRHVVRKITGRKF